MEPATNNENYNDDELVAPDWLNAEYFKEVLSKYMKEPAVKVLNVEMSPASAKGDHYASVMFRAKVSYETPKGKFSISLIIKTMPEQEGHKMDMLNNSKIFETEIGMYTKALPKFEEILKKAGDDVQLCTPCVYHSLEPRQVIIFEDLVPQGYIVHRDRGLNIDEIKAAYTKLAKMQAASFLILKEDPEYLAEFKYGVNAMPNVTEDPFMTKGMSNFIEFLDTQPELSKYSEFFKRYESSYLQNFLDTMEEYRSNRQPDGYYVLCHGDYHLRNMMFKHNRLNGSLEDCMLIDYQISNVCPMSADLLYSIFLIMGPEERRNSYKELLEFYFSVFLETLKKLGYKGELPNLKMFWEQLRRHKFIELFYLLTLPMTIAVINHTVDLSEVLQNNDQRKKLFFNEDFIAEIKYLLPRYELLGYFD